MLKNWFHIVSLERTIDLNLVSEIIWNNQILGTKSTYFTSSVYLGTSVAVSDGFGVCRNEVTIKCDKDRQRLHDCICDVSIKLCLNNQSLVKLATNDKVSKSADIPY